MKIVLVGKYTSLHDSYISVVKSLEHAALAINRKLDLTWIEAEDLEQGTQLADAERYHSSWKKLVTAQGILVPGGFGVRGSEGKIDAIKYARTNRIPFLGICLGFQMAVVEIARNICGLTDANSTELSPDTTNPVIINMPEISTTHLGGTMRLGARETIFTPEDSIIKHLYGDVPSISERHRHRYEVNPVYVAQLEKAGLKFVGKDSKGERMICAELSKKDSNFFCGVQYHPEYKTRPLKPHPLFVGFVLAASGSSHGDHDASLRMDDEIAMGRYHSSDNLNVE